MNDGLTRIQRAHLEEQAEAARFELMARILSAQDACCERCRQTRKAKAKFWLAVLLPWLAAWTVLVVAVTLVVVKK